MKTAATGDNHIHFWDRIRYLVVFCVVVLHGACAYTKHIHWWYSNSGQTAPLFDLIVAIFDLFIMPVLFLVSGYFALPSLRRHGSGGFLLGKIRRLFLPMVFLTVFYVPIINFISSQAWGRNPSGSFFAYWKHVLLSFTPVCWRVFDSVESAVPYLDDMTPNYLWYLSLLFLLMLLFLGLEVFLGRTGKHDTERSRQSGGAMLAVAAAFGVVMVLAMAGLNMLVPFGVWAQASSFLVFQPIRVPLYAGMFFLGVYANRHGWFMHRPLPGPLWGWIGGMVLSGFAFIFMVSSTQLFPGTFGRALVLAATRTAFALCMTATLTTLGFRYWTRTSGVHRLLAKSSYDLYLLHLPLMVALQYGLRFVEMSVYLKFVLAVLCTSVVCVSASRASQKWPSWLKAGAMLAVFGLVCAAS